MGKLLSVKAHLLHIVVPVGSETSILPLGFGKKLAAKGVPTILCSPDVKCTLARPLEEAGTAGMAVPLYLSAHPPRRPVVHKHEASTMNDTNRVRYLGDTGKYCEAPATHCYKFGVKVTVVPLAPRICGWRPCGTRCTRVAGNCGDVQPGVHYTQGCRECFACKERFFTFFLAPRFLTPCFASCPCSLTHFYG